MDKLLLELTGSIYSIAMQTAREKNIYDMKQYIDFALQKLVVAYQRYGKKEANFVGDTTSGQIFRYLQYFESGTIFFVFGVEDLKRTIRNNSLTAEVESLSKFGTKDDSQVYPYIYEVPDNADKIKTPLDEPIIAVPFTFIPNGRLLIVDGNHRVAKAKREKRPYISTYIMPYELCETYLFGKFECVLYTIMEELYHIKNECVNKSAIRFQSSLPQIVT